MQEQEDIKKFSDAEITVTLPQPLFKLLAAQVVFFREWVDPDDYKDHKYESVEDFLKQLAIGSAQEKLYQLKPEYREDLGKFEDDLNTVMECLTSAYWQKQSEYIDDFRDQVNVLYRELNDPERFDLYDGESIELYYHDGLYTQSEGSFYE